MKNQNYNMEKFNAAALNREATWWQMELPSRNVIFGDAKAEMLGFPSENFQSYQDFTNLVHPDDQEKIMQDMRDHLEGKKEFYETSYRIKTKKGDYLRFYDFGKVISNEKGKIVAMGFVWKIQEEVDIEKQMKEFRDIINSGENSVIEIISKIK